MLRAGYLTFADHAEDGRIKPMEPTLPLRDYFKERWAIDIAALAAVRLQFAAVSSALDRDSFHDALCRLIGQSHQKGGGLPAEPDGLSEITELDSGLMIMLRLALADRLGDSPPSANGMSREFGISRAPVSNVLQAAERAELIPRVGGRSSYAIRAPLCERMSDHCAATMLLYERVVPEALALEREQSSGP